MSKATPRPWTVKTPLMDPNAYDVYGGGVQITRGYWAHNGKADAELIVRAVNSHDELLAALRVADEMLEGNPAGVDDEADPNNPSPEDASAHTAGLIRQVLRAALAKAEARQDGVA